MRMECAFHFRSVFMKWTHLPIVLHEMESCSLCATLKDGCGSWTWGILMLRGWEGGMDWAAGEGFVKKESFVGTPSMLDSNWSQNSLVLLVTAYVQASQKNVVVDYEKSHKWVSFVWSDTYLGASRVWNGYYIFVQIGRWYCPTAWRRLWAGINVKEICLLKGASEKRLCVICRLGFESWFEDKFGLSCWNDNKIICWVAMDRNNQFIKHIQQQQKCAFDKC